MLLGHLRRLLEFGNIPLEGAPPVEGDTGNERCVDQSPQLSTASSSETKEGSGSDIEIDWSDLIEVEVEDGGYSFDGAASKPPAKLLSEAESRARVIDDLLELEAFIQQRLFEEKSSASRVQFINWQVSIPEEIRRVDVKALEVFMSGIRSALDALDRPLVKTLLEINTSGRYMDRLASSIEQLHKRSVKVHRQSVEAADRRVQIQKEVKEQEQLLQKLEARVKDLQQFVEKSLSELYNGREVNLIGEINNLSTPSAQSVASSSSGREHSSEE